MATITMKTCAGVPKWGIPSHDAHVGAFGTDHSHADGLTRVCKADWKTYLQLRAAAVAAGTAPARQARTPKVAQGDATAPEPAPVVVDGTAAQEAEQAALDAAIQAVGGPGTADGQALMAAAAADEAAARRAYRNEVQRRYRAAKRAQAQA